MIIRDRSLLHKIATARRPPAFAAWAQFRESECLLEYYSYDQVFNVVLEAAPATTDSELCSTSPLAPC